MTDQYQVGWKIWVPSDNHLTGKEVIRSCQIARFREMIQRQNVGWFGGDVLDCKLDESILDPWWGKPVEEKPLFRWRRDEA